MELLKGWRRLCLFSCTHMGSSYGLLPNNFKTEEGVKITQSPNQKYIWDCWKSFINAMDADVYIHLGDAIQGNNRKNWAAGTTVAEIDEQINMAVEILNPVAKKGKLIILRGSEYHDSLDVRAERAIAHRTGANYGGLVSKHKFKGTGVVGLFGHGKSSPMIYKAGFEERESNMLDEAIGGGRLQGPVDLVVKGHWHKFSLVDMGKRLMLRVPGWQTWYPASFMIDMFGKKNNFLGGIYLDIGPKNQTGFFPWQVHKFLYPQPNSVHGGVVV